MNIVGLDALVFGVDDVADCARYLIDYGLTPVDAGPDGGRFEGLDGTAILLARRDDPSLPPPLPTASTLRKTIYGVADAATLDAIAAELGRDRAVRWLADGSLETVDDLGFALGFRVTTSRPLSFAAEAANAPGVSAQRPVNALGVGIGVDYALYILSVTLAMMRAGMGLSEAYYRALIFTGKVVILTGVTLAAAVATWAFSDIKFQADMGILLAFMFLWNMVGALVLLPALAYLLLPGGASPVTETPAATGKNTTDKDATGNSLASGWTA